MRYESLDLSRLSEWPVVSVDVETTGKYWYKDTMFGVAVAVRDPGRGRGAKAYYDVRDTPAVLQTLKRELPRVKLLVNHSVKFDLHFLKNHGIEGPANIECTGVRAALINEHEPSHSLDALAVKYLGKAKVDIYPRLAALFGGAPTRSAQIGNLHRAPKSLAAEYATEDPDLAIDLWQHQNEVMESEGLFQVFDLEKRLLPVLMDIERRGVRVDVDMTRRQSELSEKRIDGARAALRAAVGYDINPNSPPQMRKLFGVWLNPSNNTWYTEDGTPLETTDGGQGSLGADVLRRLAAKNPAAHHITLMRKMLKAKQFLDNHILEHEHNGRVYPNYNQTKSDNDLGTGTGRFSINDPALQQIPARDIEIAEVVRACFVPDPGYEWVCADWKQFEFRWFAHYINDPTILKVYEKDPEADFHKLAADITGLPRSPRYAGDANAKQINLGLVFGMGQGRLAAEMGLPHTVINGKWGPKYIPGEEAMGVFKRYHEAIPGVEKLLSTASSTARSRGYVRTVMGRHIHFPPGTSVHKAGGLVFQGTSADCMKVKMIEMHEFSKAEGFDMLLTVHDELDTAVPKRKTKKIIKEQQRIMETFDGVNCPIKCRVPIRCAIVAGPNWWAACK